MEIGDNAFNSCESLIQITYNGTVSEWMEINKGNNWIDEDAVVTVYCTDTTIKY